MDQFLKFTILSKNFMLKAEDSIDFNSNTDSIFNIGYKHLHYFA